MKPGWLLRVLYQFDLFLYSQVTMKFLAMQLGSALGWVFYLLWQPFILVWLLLKTLPGALWLLATKAGLVLGRVPYLLWQPFVWVWLLLKTLPGALWLLTTKAGLVLGWALYILYQPFLWVGLLLEQLPGVLSFITGLVLKIIGLPFRFLRHNPTSTLTATSLHDITTTKDDAYWSDPNIDFARQGSTQAMQSFVVRMLLLVVYAGVATIILGGLTELVQRLCDSMDRHGKTVAQGMTDASQQFDQTVRYAVKAGARGMDKLEYISRESTRQFDRTVRYAIANGGQGLDRLEGVAREHSRTMERGMITAGRQHAELMGRSMTAAWTASQTYNNRISAPPSQLALPSPSGSSQIDGKIARVKLQTAKAERRAARVQLGSQIAQTGLAVAGGGLALAAPLALCTVM
jgi:hypothetical protein